MNSARILTAIALLVAVYFIFFANSLPREIEFQGHTLGPREKIENNTNRNFDIYSYRDRTNHHVMLFVMAKDESATAQQLLEFYISNFEAQGFNFRNQDNRFLGTKGDEVIYMTKAPKIDSAIAYIEKGPDSVPSSLSGTSSVFSDLENYSFE